ncbi:MAG: hypothetical protein KDD48_03245, partial [Bdellovibrionales bacterium]|nr:hypothetical protein [Bdellovibrionales bacterium]
ERSDGASRQLPKFTLVFQLIFNLLYSMILRKNDISIERLRRSGPGGQHRNKRETGIRLRHQPTGLSVLVSKNRSQKQNLEEALRLMEAKLVKLRQKKKKRLATKKTKTSIEKRLKTKRLKSQTKKTRQKIHSTNIEND